MIKVIRLLVYFLIIPVFASYGIFYNYFIRVFDSGIICHLLLLPAIISGIAFMFDKSNSFYSKISLYIIGCVFVLFGYSTLYKQVSDSNYYKRIYWENVELSDMPRESVFERSIREDGLMLTREYKLMEVEAKDIELRIEGDYYNVNSWILIITGFFLIILNYLIYRIKINI